MARKKKSSKKTDPEKASGTDPDASGASKGAKKGSSKKSAAKKSTAKKSAPKKKRARKKAAKAKVAETPDAAEEQAPETASGDPGGPKKKKEEKEEKEKKTKPGRKRKPKKKPSADEASKDGGAEIPHLDPDMGGPEEDATPAVEVAEFDDAPDVVLAADPVETEPDEDLPVEDLDAVLDDDLDGLEDLDELIAATVAGAAPEDHVGEPPVETLDVDADPSQPLPYPEAADAAAEAAEIGLTQDATVERESEAIQRAPAGEPSDESPRSTEEELAGTVDLGPVSTPEVRDRLLAQALAHAEMKDAGYRVPFSDPRRAGRWKGGVASVIFLAALAIAIAPPGWVRPEPPAQIQAADRLRSIRQGLLLQAQQVDAFRVRSQRLPTALDELADHLPGVRYVRSGSRAFQLVAYEPDGNAIVYDSSDPAPEFDRVAPEWLLDSAR